MNNDWEYAAEYMNENQIICICTFCQTLPEEVLADINQAFYTLIEISRRRIDEDDITSIFEDDLEQLENCIP